MFSIYKQLMEINFNRYSLFAFRSPLLVTRFWLLATGLWSLVSFSWRKEPGAWNPGPRSWSLFPLKFRLHITNDVQRFRSGDCIQRSKSTIFISWHNSPG